MKHLFDEHLHQAQKIRCLVCDIDGVMTDGQLHFSPSGESIKVFNVQDGLGLSLLKHSGIEVAVISGRQCPALEKRLDDLGITHRSLGQSDKRPAFASLLDQLKLSADAMAYMGDDLNDLCIMQKVGLAIAPANAAPHIKQISDVVTPQAGGHGAVRQVCDALLMAQGLWEPLIREMM